MHAHRYKAALASVGTSAIASWQEMASLSYTCAYPLSLYMHACFEDATPLCYIHTGRHALCYMFLHADPC